MHEQGAIALSVAMCQCSIHKSSVQAAQGACYNTANNCLPCLPWLWAQLACARLGAVHSVVFAGFSAEALAGRLQVGVTACPAMRHHVAAHPCCCFLPTSTPLDCMQRCCLY